MALEMLFLAAEEAVYPQGPFCPAGLLCFNYTWIFQVVNFLIFTVVLNVILYKPILKVFEDREEYILGKRNGAKAKLAEIQATAAKYEAELVATRRHAQDIVAQAEAEAMKIRTEKLAQVQAEAQARLETNRAQIAQEKAQALTTLQREVATLSEQITRKLLATR